MKINKKYLVWLIIIIVLVIAGMIIYTYLKPKPLENSNSDNSLGNLKPQGLESPVSQPSNPTNQPNNLNLSDAEKFYSVVEKLNPTECNKLGGEYKTKCLSDIDFIKNAKTPESCFDESVNIDSIIRYLCMKDASMRRTG